MAEPPRLVAEIRSLELQMAADLDAAQTAADTAPKRVKTRFVHSPEAMQKAKLGSKLKIELTVPDVEGLKSRLGPPSCRTSPPVHESRSVVPPEATSFSVFSQRASSSGDGWPNS